MFPAIKLNILLRPVIAGRDTTAQTLTWTFYSLAKNPEVEKKTRVEVVNALGETGLPNYENLSNLKYLTALFNETLRLFANVPTNTLSCTKDTVLAGSGTPVYEGEIVQYSPWAMGYSTKWVVLCLISRNAR
jgi:cytochrome P450